MKHRDWGQREMRRKLDLVDRLLQSSRLVFDVVDSSLEATPLLDKALRLLTECAGQLPQPSNAPARRLTVQLDNIHQQYAGIIVELARRAPHLEAETTPDEDSTVVEVLEQIEDVSLGVRAQLRRVRLRELANYFRSNLLPGRLFASPAQRMATWVILGMTAVVAIAGRFVAASWADSDCINGTYFADQELRSAVANRCDPAIDFNWPGSPIAGIDEDHFSIEWQAQLQVPEDGEYIFYLTSDDGSRLTINGGLVIENWGYHVPLTKTATVTLAKGSATIHLVYFEGGGAAMIRWEWESKLFPRRVVGHQDFTTP